jgi:hypothetical protein
LLVVALLAGWQVANASGFFWEGLVGNPTTGTVPEQQNDPV